MKHIKKYENFSQEEYDDELIPIGISEPEGINGLVHIFSPLEEDMVEDWNNDEKIKKFIEEERLFLQEISYDEWSIWGVEGDNEVKRYVNKHYSW